MNVEEARRRATEMAKLLGLGGEDTARLLMLAKKWAPLDVDALDHEAVESLAAAEREPSSPLRGARQLLVTTLREKAMIEALPDEAREEYLARLHGIGTAENAAGPDEEPERKPPSAHERNAEQIAELRKHPAMMDPKHPEHDAVVRQLVELHRDE